MPHRDKAVSEIVGTMLVFAIVVSAISTFEVWYVPSTQASYDQQFQVNSQQAMASLVSQLESPSLVSGQIISQGVPMGIQGSFLTPSIQSQIMFQKSGFSASLSYQVGINYRLLENTVPTAITNKVVGSFPSINGRVPTQAVYLDGDIFVTDYQANAISEINATTGTLVGEFNAGMNPYGIVTYGGLLYISNFFSFYTPSFPYSTITVFNPVTHEVVMTINARGITGNLLYPSGMVVISNNLYVSDLNETNTGHYIPQMVEINLLDPSEINIIVPPSAITSYSGNHGVNTINNTSGDLTPAPSTLVSVNVAEYGNNYQYVWMTDYFQSAVTIYNVSTPGYWLIFHYLNHPFGIYYDSYTQQVFISDSQGFLFNHAFPGKGKHLGQKKQALQGNITIESATNPNGTPKALLIPVSLPTGITMTSRIAGESVYSTLYVGSYNEEFNGTGKYWYSSVAAINMTNFSASLHQYNDSRDSINMNGQSGFLIGPVYLAGVANIPGGGLVVVNNGSNNILIVSNLSGTHKLDYVWNSPFNSPTSIAFDSGQNLLAVGNAISDNVALINPVDPSQITFMSAGVNVTSVAYDPANNYIYTANNGSNNVTIISPVLGKSVGNVSITDANGILTRPNFVAYDPINGSVYVITTNSSTIYELKNGVTLSSNVISLPSGSGPISGTFVPNGTLFVLEYNTGKVAEVNLTRGHSVQNFTVGSKPDAVCFDSLSNSLYVSNYGSHNVSVISLSTDVVAHFTVGSGAYPTGLAFDPANGYLYVSNSGSNNVTLNNTFTKQTIGNIAAGLSPSSIKYDSENGLIYVVDGVSNQVTAINGGSIYFNNKTGKFLSNELTGSGQMVSYGYTAYTPSVSFHLQDNMVLSNYSSSQYVVSSANIPVSISNNSGNITVSASLLNLAGHDTSYSGTGTSSIVLNLTSVTRDQYYIGERFTYFDLYGNGYPAMVTGLYLFGLNYTIHSAYSQEINNLLFNHYNSSHAQISNSWRFSNYPFIVKSTNSTISVVSTKVITIFSVDVEYISATVVGV